MAAARTWILDQLDAERGRWMLWLPVAMGLGIAVYFELPSDSHRCGRPPVVTWILRMIRSALVSASLVFGGLLRRFACCALWHICCQGTSGVGASSRCELATLKKVAFQRLTSHACDS